MLSMALGGRDQNPHSTEEHRNPRPPLRSPKWGRLLSQHLFHMGPGGGSPPGPGWLAGGVAGGEGRAQAGALPPCTAVSPSLGRA